MSNLQFLRIEHLHKNTPQVLLGVCMAFNLYTQTAQADVITFPQSSLIASNLLYTDIIGGGIGDIVVTTGGGNDANVGDPSGRNDDGYRGPIDFGFTSAFSFFGNSYTQFFANNNGNISFNNGISAFVPQGPIGANQPTISAFFGDVDTRGANSGVLYLRTDIPEQIILTWDHVGRFSARDDLLNSFQIVLRGSDYVVPTGQGSIGFFYGDMQWTSTDTSTLAAVGFGDGSGNASVVQGTNEQANLHESLSNHYTWFTKDLEVVQPGPISVAEPSQLLLLSMGFALLGFTWRHPSQRFQLAISA